MNFLDTGQVAAAGFLDYKFVIALFCRSSMHSPRQQVVQLGSEILLERSAEQIFRASNSGREGDLARICGGQFLFNS
jgi:hypothetical protein